MSGLPIQHPLISVIITCYNRRNFLSKSIESVLSQKTDRENIEIIVTKNFKDDLLDSIIKQNGIFSILENDIGIGLMIYNATKAARGEYICFLDDDDLFYDQKLNRAKQVIVSHPGLMYYHNAFNSIDDSGKELTDLRHKHPSSTVILDKNNPGPSIRNARKLSGDVNMSSITLKRDLIVSNADRLIQITGLQDVFMFFLASATEGTMIIDSAVLTGYRIHSSESHSDMTQLEAYSSGLRAVTLKYLRTYEVLITIKGRQWKEVKYEYITNKCRYNLLARSDGKKLSIWEILYLLFHLTYAENKRNQVTLIGFTILRLFCPSHISSLYIKQKMKFEKSKYVMNE